MTRTLAIALAAMLAPALASADACRDEIAALFDTGPLNPFNLPPNHVEKEVLNPDGSRQYILDIHTQSPTRIVSGIRGGMLMMMVGSDTWMGPSLDGPWTAGQRMQTDDMEAAQRTVPEAQARNLSDTECPGITSLDGKDRLTYVFRTRTDPHPARGNSWWGSLDRVYIDPATGLIDEIHQTEHVASWAEGMKMETHILRYSYDPDLRIEPPE
ncbi:hypothetical protein [Pseudaestuariivita atlantica]|uniref:Lipoprotein n=1 Tax=Pseudaestuariivita atlantica TaxID=1317121 RepID=A0A0L1JSG6_9RHOB|nr:hypothetical protein [Pseudaestuariivita atlantica]KNG94700.1 hypothetical protein ATO11_04730 [Pseudaestuariivita atlantica]